MTGVSFGFLVGLGGFWLQPDIRHVFVLDGFRDTNASPPSQGHLYSERSILVQEKSSTVTDTTPIVKMKALGRMWREGRQKDLPSFHQSWKRTIGSFPKRKVVFQNFARLPCWREGFCPTKSAGVLHHVAYGSGSNFAIRALLLWKLPRVERLFDEDAFSSLAWGCGR